MPRRSGGGGGGGRRPMPARPSAPPQQTRPATTAARPPATTQQPQQGQAQQSQSPGLFGQMASTAAGVAIGSSIGHAIGGMFGGSSVAAEQVQADAATAQSSSYQPPKACENDVNAFRKCMDDNQGSLTICGWYLDQLKACQAAASPY